jgi:hypothetical protein
MPRPASVRRSARHGPLPLAQHRPAPPARARHVSPPRRPTSGCAAILAGSHTRRGRATAHAALCTASPSPWCARKHPTASKLDYKSASPSFARGNTAPPSRHSRPSVLTVNSTSGRLSPQTRAAPASLVHRQSSHTRLLATLSCRLVGAKFPAAAPPHPTTGRLSAVCKPLCWIPTTPRPSLATFPATPAAGLAEIQRAAPPSSPLDHIAMPQIVPGSLVRTRDLFVIC